MNMRSNDSRYRIWQLLKWTLGVPGVLLLIIVMAIAARYFPSKARLDRLKSSNTGMSQVSIVFEPVVPTWIRKLVGDERCNPLDGIKAIILSSPKDYDLIKWRGCFDAETIMIESSPWDSITDRGLSELGDLRLLKCLEIEYGHFTSQGLQALAKSPHLTNLKLDSVKLSSDWYDTIRQFPKLKQLEVFKRPDEITHETPEITVHEVEALATHPHFRSVRLNLSMRNNEDGPLAPVDDSLIGCIWRFRVNELTRGFTEPLAKLRDLDTLVIHCDTMTPDALAPLARMPSLRRLHLVGQITEQHLNSLEVCPKLESLAIVSYEESDEPNDHGLRHLAGFPSLKVLVLYLRLTPKDLEGLGQLTNLKALRVGFDYEDASKGIERLKSLGNLEELDLGIIENGNDLDVILSMPKLRWLRFDTNATLPHHLQELASRSAVPTHLKADFPQAHS